MVTIKGNLDQVSGKKGFKEADTFWKKLWTSVSKWKKGQMKRRTNVYTCSKCSSVEELESSTAEVSITRKRQQGGDLTQSYDKSPYTNRNVKGQVTTQTTSQKSSIKQRLRTDLGRSVGATIYTNKLLIIITYQKYIKRHPNRAGCAPPGWKRAQVWWLKESRLTIRGDKDQDHVASKEVWTRPVI